MPPTTAQRNAIAQFQAFTGAQDKIAATYMKRYAYNLEQATDAFFATSGTSSAGSSSKAVTNLNALFDSYRDPQDEKDTVGIDGTMKYFGDIGVNFDDSSLFVALEAVRATTMGELEKSAFVNGWKDASISKPLDTLKTQQAYISQQKEALSTDLAVFKRIYRNIFLSAKDKGQKALPLENAVMYWMVIFAEMPWSSGGTDWMALWHEYLNAKWSKSVNKDMWNQTFEFYAKSMRDPTLSFWSEDSAWPGVIDEFVVYAKEKGATNGDRMQTD